MHYSRAFWRYLELESYIDLHKDELPINSLTGYQKELENLLFYMFEDEKQIIKDRIWANANNKRNS